MLAYRVGTQGPLDGRLKQVPGISFPGYDTPVDATHNVPTLEQVVGQEQVVSRLQEFADHFLRRGEALDHLLLIGPHGMGQSMIAKALAGTVRAGVTETAGNLLEKKGDLTAILTSLDPRDILIVRNGAELRQPLVEVLIPALREFRIDLVIGQGVAARVHPYKLNRFTCVACVERESDISPKLRDEFALPLTLQPYSISELSKIARLIALDAGREIDESAALLVASACQGSPHQEQILIRRIGMPDGQRITEAAVREYLSVLGLRVGSQAPANAAMGVDGLSGVEFEQLVGGLLIKMGFQVEITKASGDGGIDIIASLAQPLLRGRYLIQCKRFSESNSVGAPVIREFYGAIRADHRVVKGIFITTSTFTQQATEFAENVGIELIDREGLQRLLAQYGTTKRVATPPHSLF